MNENIIIDISGGQPTVTSRDIAEHFGKRHSDVLEAIKAGPNLRLGAPLTAPLTAPKAAL